VEICFGTSAEPGDKGHPFGKDMAIERVIAESDMALQVCTAGNLRTALLCAYLAREFGAWSRLIIATGTPT
jgi:enamidase